jgi:hypothetical protein
MKNEQRNDFQLISCTLDAVTKIYAHRVDSMHFRVIGLAEEITSYNPMPHSKSLNVKKKSNHKTCTNQESTLADQRAIKLTQKTLFFHKSDHSKKIIDLTSDSDIYHTTEYQGYFDKVFISGKVNSWHCEKNFTQHLVGERLGSFSIEAESICRPRSAIKSFSKQIHSLMSLMYGSGIFLQHIPKNSTKCLQMALDFIPSVIYNNKNFKLGLARLTYSRTNFCHEKLACEGKYLDSQNLDCLEITENFPEMFTNQNNLQAGLSKSSRLYLKTSALEKEENDAPLTIYGSFTKNSQDQKNSKQNLTSAKLCRRKIYISCYKLRSNEKVKKLCLNLLTPRLITRTTPHDLIDKSFSNMERIEIQDDNFVFHGHTNKIIHAKSTVNLNPKIMRIIDKGEFNSDDSEIFRKYLLKASANHRKRYIGFSFKSMVDHLNSSTVHPIKVNVFFLCLLHLASENGLSIRGSNNFDDVLFGSANLK